MFGLFIALMALRNYGLQGLLVIPVIAALAIGISAIIWMKTEYTFGETEMHVAKRTLFAKDTRIQYSRLASVNINRGLFNRLTDTSTLLFNVNSSVNSVTAEAKLCLKIDKAEALREELSALIFQKEITVKEDMQVETLVKVSNAEIVMHGFLSQHTLRLLFGLSMLAYSILQLMYNDGSGVIMPLLLFFISEAVPVCRTILKYFNYRIYRVGDTVTVESGMITTYRSSFKVGKVNSVRIRQPLIARALGKATLEAEVVGIAGEDSIPLLCPLKPRSEVDSLLVRMLPEFDIPVEPIHEPRSAIIPTSLSAFVASLIAASVMVGLIHVRGSIEDDLAGTVWLIAMVLVALFIVLMLIRAVLLHRNRAIMLGGDILVMELGGYDTSREYFLYDKVQVAGTRAGPVARRRGLSRCSVGLISATGSRHVLSGIFDDAVSSRVQEIVMDRIRDGRYDYRRYQRFAVWRNTPCRGPSGPRTPSDRCSGRLPPHPCRTARTP